MKYQCSNPKCGKQFTHTAKLTEVENDNHATAIDRSYPVKTIETCVCPYCHGIDYAAIDEIPAAIEAPQPDKVYVLDLVSGENPEFERLRKEGYIVTQKYAKQWHMEKLPPIATPTKPT